MIDVSAYLNVPQLIGAFASAFIILGYFSKVDNRAKKILICGSALFAIHFFMMGAMTAMLINGINFFRVGLSIRFHGSKSLFTFFVLIYLLVGYTTYETRFDALPLISSLVGCISMYFLSGISFRLCTVVGSLCWLIHNVAIGSIGGVVTEVFVLIGVSTAIYRLILDKRKMENA